MQHLKVRTGPAGVHLFNRKTGLNVLLDEVRVARHSWHQAPRQVSVALTNACDLTCAHCYAPKQPGALEPEMVADWLSELDANGCMGVGFGGGEPTLFKALPKLCRDATENTGLAISITTHAHHLTERFTGELNGHIHFLRISMDGIGATYERIRGRSFEALRAKFEAARTVCRFGINYLVNRDTVDEIDAAVAFAESIGASEFLLLPERPVGSRPGADSATIKKLQRYVGSYRATLPLATSDGAADLLPVCNTTAGETGLRAYAHIDARGMLKASSFDVAGVAIKTDGIIQALQSLGMLQEK